MVANGAKRGMSRSVLALCDEQKPCRDCARHNVECSLLWPKQLPVAHLALAPRLPSFPQDSPPAASTASSPSTPGVLAFRQSAASPQAPRGPPGPPGTASPLSRLSMISNLVHELAAEIQTQAAPRLNVEVAPNSSQVDYTPDWMTSLKLLNHYYTSTCLTLHHDSATLHLWRVDVPSLAVSHEALMHGLLAISALHYAHTHPDERQPCIRDSTYHQGRALQFFSTNLATINDDNREPLFILAIFIFMLETWVIAHPQSPEEPTSSDAVFRSFALVQGIQTIFDCPSKDLTKGMLYPLFDRSKVPPIDPSQPFAKRIEQIAGLVEAIDEDESLSRDLCRDGLDSLRNAYARHRSPHISQPRMWMWRVEMGKKRFNTSSRHPVGIIIIAHCAALTKCSEGPVWLWDGWSEHVLEMAVRELDQEWQEWLQWPLRCVRDALDVDMCD